MAEQQQQQQSPQTPVSVKASPKLYDCGDCSPAKTTLIDTRMNSGTICFRKQLPFHTMLQGSINGTAFTIEGKGYGDSNTGHIKGKWVCTNGKLPMSWAALASTLQYGFKCFINFPNGLTHFYQESMPQGFTQEKVARYQDDGTIKTYHEIHLQKGVVVNKITLQGEGFKPDSPVLSNGLKIFLPLETRVFPFEDGLKSLAHYVYPLKDDSGYAVATVTEVNRPLGEGRVVATPAPHFVRSHMMQFRDTDDDSDHIIQEERVDAHHVHMFDH